MLNFLNGKGIPSPYGWIYSCGWQRGIGIGFADGDSKILFQAGIGTGREAGRETAAKFFRRCAIWLSGFSCFPWIF